MVSHLANLRCLVSSPGLSAQLCVAAVTPHWQVHIVTRQHTSHERAIVAVLDSAGLGHVQVHCLGGTKLRKADVILPLLQQVIVLSLPPILIPCRGHVLAGLYRYCQCFC